MNNSNSTGDCLAYPPDIEMTIFDSFPPKLRSAIANANQDYANSQIETMRESGMSIKEVINAIRKADEHYEQETLRNRNS